MHYANCKDNKTKNGTVGLRSEIVILFCIMASNFIELDLFCATIVLNWLTLN